MNSKYRMIEVEARNIDDMVSELLEYKSRGEMVSTVFNGRTIYSDTVSLDGANEVEIRSAFLFSGNQPTGG